MTWTILGLVLLSAAVQVEVWPLTAFRLFSVVRTGSQTGHELLAISPDGARHRVRPPGDNPLLVTTTHQLGDLPHLPTQRQQEKVSAWLALAQIDPADVEVVQLDRVTRVMSPDTREWHEVSRETVAEFRW